MKRPTGKSNGSRSKDPQPRADSGPQSLDAVAARDVAAAPAPSVEQIRLRAYQIYLARKGVGGSPDSDWAQAERELTGELRRVAQTGTKPR